ncbi:hypothetical protein [uncultured Succinivibrio sp.]|uniref:hypothetical protein n=1 Tax=uncultured Succinivibrio sp. TaxID=540749 RepID=UPI0025E673E7|nr:hypothetical protein [uncultured Succinivibrio sp.]
MKRFNFEDGIFELDSLLLCNIGPVGGATSGTPTTPTETTNVQDPKKPKGTDKTNAAGNEDGVPDANNKPKDPKDPSKTTLKDPAKPTTPQNARDLLASMESAEKTIINITELMMAIIKMNRERKDMEVKMMWSECQNICNNIQTQADNMRKDALRNVIIGVCCSVISIGAGGLSMYSAGNALKDINKAAAEFAKGGANAQGNLDIALKQIDNTAKWWNGIAEIAKGVGQMGGSFNDYFSKEKEAENKGLDALTEVFRTAMEEVKKNLDDARNAITSCQSNISELLQSNRQTLNKVMG